MPPPGLEGHDQPSVHDRMQALMAGRGGAGGPAGGSGQPGGGSAYNNYYAGMVAGYGLGVGSGNAPVPSNQKNFPETLFDVINAPELHGHIISWLPHGQGFIIHDKMRFSSNILPRYFDGAKFTSFTRRLKRWSFVRVPRGPELGAYYNKNFVRDRPELVKKMRYQSDPRLSGQSKKARAAVNKAAGDDGDVGAPPEGQSGGEDNGGKKGREHPEKGARKSQPRCDVAKVESIVAKMSARDRSSLSEQQMMNMDNPSSMMAHDLTVRAADDEHGQPLVDD